MDNSIFCLKNNINKVFGNFYIKFNLTLNELTVLVKLYDYFSLLKEFRDNKLLLFNQLIDLCGVDYLTYSNKKNDFRFAVVLHLLSTIYNWRVRVRVFIPDDDILLIPSVVNIWSSANWYEREAFDLFGIVFEGHPDLRRILTDYGFVGYPFRKDFPMSGYVEMFYSKKEKRVIYKKINIDKKSITPKIVKNNDL